MSRINLGIAMSIVEKACVLDGRGFMSGCLCIASATGQIEMVMEIGNDANPDSAIFNLRTSQDTARRLAFNPSHMSSWQSRNIACGNFGGAVRDAFGTIYSFSGLSEEINEAVSIKIARSADFESMRG